MTGLSSTARRGRGRFSRPDGSDAEEDRGRNGNNRTPDNRGSREECNDGSALPATAVNPLDSVKHAYRRRLEGGGGGTTRRRRRRRRMTTATTAASSRNGAGREGR
jgi:hypothetical protein